MPKNTQLLFHCFSLWSFQRVDITAVPYVWNLLKSNYVTFLHPFRYTHISILLKKPEPCVEWTVLLSCFKWQVYVCGLVTLVVVTTFILMFKRVSSHQNGHSKRDGHPTLETIMLTIGVTCNQGIMLLFCHLKISDSV